MSPWQASRRRLQWRHRKRKIGIETVPWSRRLGESPTRHPLWGVALTMWHHVAHQRGSMVVYLRLKGVEPPGYVD